MFFVAARRNMLTRVKQKSGMAFTSHLVLRLIKYSDTLKTLDSLILGTENPKAKSIH